MVTQTQAAASVKAGTAGMTRKTPSAGGARSTSCGCGQQLDCCQRQHCPRCGRSIQNA
jgi:hypothetical protein